MNIGGTYQASITSVVGGFIRLDYERIGPTAFREPPVVGRKSIGIVGLHVGIEDLDGDKWSLVSHVSNLTDEEYNIAFGDGFAHPARPRIWSVEYTYNF